MRYQSSTGSNPLYDFRPPLLPHLPLPPLPPITDPDLYRMVMTHTSEQQLSRRSAIALAPPQEGTVKVWAYERLNHVGDGLLESMASGLLQDLYPWLRQGGAAILRDHLVSNHSLAQISLMYDLPASILADVSSIEAVMASEKIQASVLEAYIAGVFYSFLKLPRTANPAGAGDGESGVELIERQEQTPVVMSAPRHVGIFTPATAAEAFYAYRLETVRPAATPTTTNQPQQPQMSGGSSLRSLAARFAPTAGEDRHSDGGDGPSETLQAALEPDNKPGLAGPAQSASAELEGLIGSLLSSTPSTKKQNLTPSAPAFSSVKVRSTRSPALISTLTSTSTSTTWLLDPFTTAFVPARQRAPITAVSHPLLVPDAATAPCSVSLFRTKGEAYDHLLSWLTPLLTPFAQFLYTHLLAEQQRLDTTLPPDDLHLEVPSEWAEEDRKAIGMVQAISQHPHVKAGGSRPVYEKFAEKGRRWRVVCTVVDGEGREWKGEGIRQNGQAAKNIAAWMMYKALGQ